MKSRETLTGLGTPELERLLVILAARDDETLSRMPVDAFDIGAMSA